MWQRFTERARRVIFFAQEEAGRLGESCVSTEHLLLGLVRENDSVAARILDRMGISLGRIRSEVERQVTRGDGRLQPDMQITPRGKRVIDLAYDEARQLGNNYIGTEHLLLGLIREYEGMAGKVLEKLGVDLETTRAEVRILQDSDGGKPAMNALETRFGDLFAKLSEAQRLTLESQGMAVVGLPNDMQELLKELFPVVNRNWLLHLSTATIRVTRQREETATQFHLVITPTITTDFTCPDPPSDASPQA